MAMSPQRLTIYLYSAHRAVIFAIAQLSCFSWGSGNKVYAIFGKAPLSAADGRRVGINHHNRSTGVDTAVFGPSYSKCIRIGENCC